MAHNGSNGNRVFITPTVRAPTSQKFHLVNVFADPVRGLLDRRGRGNIEGRSGVQIMRRKTKAIPEEAK